MRLTRYQQAGARAVDAYLREHAAEAVVAMYTLGVVADRAACAAGRKSELFASVYDYAALLPSGTRTGQAGSTSNSLYSTTNPYAAAPPTDPFVVPMPGAFDAATDAHMF